MNESRIPKFSQLVTYYDADRKGFTIAKLAVIKRVHEPENPASRLDLQVSTLEGVAASKDVPFGPNCVGHWGWGK